MAEFVASNIRNVALIGHGGEGKTTLAEAVLFNAKAIDRQGKTDDGNTTMDFDPEEIAKKISISLASANCVYKNTKLNLLDVPGFFDFEGEFNLAMTAASSAIVVCGANGTLTVGTEKALDYCIANQIPTMLFINGMDKENANYTNTLRALQEKYGTKIAPVQIPYMIDTKMKGYVSVVENKLHMFDSEQTSTDVPDALKGEAEKLFGSIVEVAAENDDKLLDKFFSGEALTADEIMLGIRKGLNAGTSIPVYCGSALTNKGVINLMNELVACAPSPADSKPVKAVDGNGKEIELVHDSGKPLVARIFKTIADPFVGRLSMFKVICGTIKSGITVRNSTKDADEKISSIYFLRGKKQEPADSAQAGDIGAISKLTITTTGDTLCDAGHIVVLPQIELPAQVLSMAVYAAKKGEEEKVFSGLARLSDEDVSFSVSKNPETNEMLLNGVGEAQLELLVKKLKNKFGVEAVLKEPRLAYRETIKRSVEAEGKHKKQSGGAGQYGHCKIRFEPGEQTFEFVDAVVGGAVPRQFIPAVEKGLLEVINKGVLAGYPMVNLKATLFDGSYHDVDSKEIAFKMAAAIAYKEGCAKASPAILEPIYTMKITVPDSFMGDILGDMNKRRGRILGMEMSGNNQVINAEAPLSEIMKYATDLRSMTQGRGKYTIEFNRYEEVPAQQTTKIIEDAKRLAEAE